MIFRARNGPFSKNMVTISVSNASPDVPLLNFIPKGTVILIGGDLTMMHDETRDYITIKDNQGQLKDFAVEALFEMEGNSYALLAADDITMVMQVEGEEGDQYLVGISDPVESQSILDAYQIAVKEAPAE